ncbi:MAG: 4Fe-4S dicluster domain-containing protein [Euryarchaeota archaeon]|nr:4Fe-4S dicluster domain-containing protein [Euryarchaeota archaeon]
MKKIIVKLDKCIGCRSCEIACAREHSTSKNGERITADTTSPRSRIAVKRGSIAPTSTPEMRPAKGRSRNEVSTGKAIPIRCRHCDDPACVAACMSGALLKDEDGAVRHYEDQCVGCWMCVMTCPYGAIIRDTDNKIVMKCDLCPERDTPACVEACKTGAMLCLIDVDSDTGREEVAEGSD